MKCADVAFAVVPRIEVEFDFDMVFCFGLRLAPYAVVFHSDLPSTDCTTC